MMSIVSWARVVSRAPEQASRLSLHYSEHLVGVDGRSFRNPELNDAAGLWRLDFILHLHRFYNDDTLAQHYFITCAKQHSHDSSGHGRDKVLAPFDSVLRG